MTDINRVRVRLSGAAVTGPGVATHYVLGIADDAMITAIRAFWTSMASHMPNSLAINVETGGEVLDDNTGDVVRTWSAGVGGTIFGAGATAYAQGVGARIVWGTAGVTGNRRVRGSTYIVPIVALRFHTDGTLVEADRATMANQATTLVATLAGRLVIMSRRTPEHSGTSHAVLNATVPDTPTWLRSRRT